MATKIFDVLKKDDKIIDFVDVYNNNNSTLEEQIESLKKRIETLEENYNKKLDRNSFETKVKNEVIRVMDNDYNTEDASERRFVRIEDVERIINEKLNIG